MHNPRLKRLRHRRTPAQLKKRQERKLSRFIQKKITSGVRIENSAWVR